MGFRKFFISVIKNIIILLVATLLFSTVSLELPDLIKGVFEDIFGYANPEMQKQVIGKLSETCSSLGNSEKSLSAELKNIGIVCKDYSSGKINDKELFFSFISGAIPGEAKLNTGFLDKYNQAVNYLSKNKIAYFLILSVLTGLLYLLIMDVKLFISALAGISFSIGILILLPYFIILAYDNFVGIDTTPLLGSIFGEGSFDIKAIVSVILLLFLRTYNNFIIAMGVLFLAMGIIGKIYSIFLKKRPKKAKTATTDEKESENHEMVKKDLDELAKELKTKKKKKKS